MAYFGDEEDDVTNENNNGETLQRRKVPLANDMNGDPIYLPPEAVAWRVRKMAARAGRPKAIFDPETGRQLEIRIEATIEELAEAVSESGRYRLEALDVDGHHIPGYVAFTEVLLDSDEQQQSASSSNGSFAEMAALVKQLVDTNSRVMEAMASAFGQVRPMRSSTPAIVEAAAPRDAGPSSDMATINSIAEVIKSVLSGAQPAQPVAQET
jgi:hypothetical protein